jgi:hypothetical protein
LHGFDGGGAAGGQGRGQGDHYRIQQHCRRERNWIECGNAIEQAAEEAAQGYDGRQSDGGSNGGNDGHLANNEDYNVAARRA